MFEPGLRYRMRCGRYCVPALCLWRGGGRISFWIDPRDGGIVGASGRVSKVYGGGASVPIVNGWRVEDTEYEGARAR